MMKEKHINNLGNLSKTVRLGKNSKSCGAIKTSNILSSQGSTRVDLGKEDYTHLARDELDIFQCKQKG